MTINSRESDGLKLKLHNSLCHRIDWQGRIPAVTITIISRLVVVIVVLVLVAIVVTRPAQDKGQFPQPGGSKLRKHEQNVSFNSITSVTV